MLINRPSLHAVQAALSDVRDTPRYDDIPAISSLEDIQNLQTTSSFDLGDTPKDFIPRTAESNIKGYYHSSGYSGNEKLIYYTDHDIEFWKHSLQTALQARYSKDSISMLYGLMNSSSENIASNFLGKHVVPDVVSSYDSADVYDEEHVAHLLRENEYDIAFLALPTMLRIFNNSEPIQNAVEVIYSGGMTMTQSRKHQLESFFDADVCNFYSQTEAGGIIAVQCPESNHYHFTHQDSYLYELEPLEQGRSELIYTPLRRDGTQLLRYKSGDIVVQDETDCSCDKRSYKILGRKGDSTVLGWMNFVLHPDLRNALRNHGLTTFRIELDSDSQADILRILTPDTAEELEVKKAIKQGDGELHHQIQEGFINLEVANDDVDRDQRAHKLEPLIDDLR